MTQKELATASGYTESAIKRLEAGRKTGGWTKTVEAVRKAMGISLKLFLDQAQQMAFEAALKEFLLKYSKVANCSLALLSMP